jgi:carboxymethylenebutenolidase
MRRPTVTPFSLAIAALLACTDAEPPAAAPAADGYADSMAREHADDRPEPAAAGDAAGAATVDGEEVAYAVLDGTPVTGYLARADGTAAVLVIQEWWGLNDNIRTMARELAAEGYTALAVDLYEGELATDPERARELVTSALQRTDRLAENLRQAHRYLSEELGMEEIGVIGWCFGGGWSLQTALLLGPELDAAVLYYGRIETDPAALAPLAAPLLGHFGAEDDSIPVEEVRAFEAAAGEAGKEVTVHLYEGAGHAFANPSGSAYDAEAADTAWERTLAFFDRHLRSGD